MRTTILFFLASFIISNVGAQIYVVETSAGLHNGTSWADAYTDLQTAIYEANAGDTIWVAQGAYKPSLDTLGTIPPVTEQRSFWLKNNVVIYGGFNGTETSLSQRDPINLKATLEGEISPGSFAEHVLYVYSNIDSTAIINGFIIQHGKSIVTSTEKNGSGMMLRGSADFYNMEFRNNETYNQGGAVYGESSSALFVSCRFESNSTIQYDGAACNFAYSDIEMYNCVFYNNHANRFGGAITTVESDLLVQNGTFAGNTAVDNIFQFSTSGDIHLNHCIFTADNIAPTPVGSSGATVSFAEGLMPFDNNWLILCATCWSGIPTFVNAGIGDFSLSQGSLGIDDTLAITPANNFADIAGNPRSVGFSIDLGAYEFQGVTGTTESNLSTQLSAYPNPASSFLSIQTEENIESISIMNTAGQIVQTENNQTFSVEHLPAGMYFLKVRTEKGEGVMRFVRE